MSSARPSLLTGGRCPILPWGRIQPFREKGCLLEHLVHRLCPWSVRKPRCLRASSAASPVAVTAKRLTPCESLVRREPSVAVLVALADMNLQLGDLTEAKDNALKAVAADPREHAARVLLARVRTALDERDAALADFRAALELARPRMAPADGGPIAVPAHQALHNLEQLVYLEQVDNRAPGTLLPVAAGLREVAQRKLNQVLDECRQRDPRDSPGRPIRSDAGRSAACGARRSAACALSQPARRLERCRTSLQRRGQRDRLRRPSADTGSARPVAALLPAIDCLAPAVSAWLSSGQIPNPAFSARCCCRSQRSCGRPYPSCWANIT